MSSCRKRIWQSHAFLLHRIVPAFYVHLAGFQVIESNKVVAGGADGVEETVSVLLDGSPLHRVDTLLSLSLELSSFVPQSLQIHIVGSCVVNSLLPELFFSLLACLLFSELFRNLLLRLSTLLVQ